MRWWFLLIVVAPACGGLTLTPTIAEEEPQMVPEAASYPRLVRRDAGLASDASLTRWDERHD